MLCDSCVKEKICKYAENCRILERDVGGSKIEDIITLEIKCKEHMTRPIGLGLRPPKIPSDASNGPQFRTTGVDMGIYPEGLWATLP